MYSLNKLNKLPNKCTHEKNYENIYLSVSYNFSKFDEFMKIKV